MFFKPIVDPVGWYKNMTREGYADFFLELTLGARRDGKGIFHLAQDYWQSFEPVGYNQFYDYVLMTASGATGGSAESNPFYFTVNGEEYVIWAWKGDYINLGAGAETGIYKAGVGGHYLTASELAMPMTLTLTHNKHGEIFNYQPSDNQWWITGFDPQHQNVYAGDMTSITTIDFSAHPDLWEGFYAEFGNKKSRQGLYFDVNTKRVTITW